jgi:hypothetical protein
MDVGEQVAATDVMIPTPTLTEPDLVVSCVDVAVIVDVPVEDGVNTPAEVIVPPVADNDTALL